MALSSILQTIQNATNIPELGSTSIIVTVIVSLCAIAYFVAGRKKYKLPPGPTGLPILGYLPFVDKEPHKTFAALAKKYGNVFGLYLGRKYTVILNDWTSFKDAFSQTATANRPEDFFGLLPDGFGFGGKNGVEWSEQRRASMKAMKNIGLGKTRWEELVQEEINELVNLMQQEHGRPLDVSELFSSTFANNIMTLVFGNRLPLGHPATLAVSQHVDLVVRSFPSVSATAAFPWLVKLLGKIGTYNYSIPLKKLSEFNQLITKMIMNRNEKESDDNFVDTYCNEMKLNIRSKMTTSFTETYLRGNTQALLIGGSDSTRSSLIYLLMAVAQFPEVQNKVYEELDHVLGKDGCITWAERSKVPYTYAVIMESMRWYTLVPVNSIRMASEDIKVQGYDIPKGSYILVNTWLLHNDPKYWPVPEKFIPERYLLNDGKKVNYKPDSYSPFSYGKRSCPGEMVALVSLLHYFTTIMQKFKILPEGEKIEYRTILGLTCQPTDVKLRFIARE